MIFRLLGGHQKEKKDHSYTFDRIRQWHSSLEITLPWMDRAPNFISTFSFKLVSFLILVKIYLRVFPYKMQWQPLIFFVSPSNLLHCRVGTSSQMIMAPSRLSSPFSLLVLSLLVIACAGYDDSSKYGFDGIPADIPQANPNYGTKEDIYTPKPEDKEKPYYGTQKEEKEHRLSIGVRGLFYVNQVPGILQFRVRFSQTTTSVSLLFIMYMNFNFPN